MARFINQYGFWIILLLTLFSRAFLFTTHGAYFFPDEEWYDVLHSSLNSYDASSFLQTIFQINGRPGFGLLYFLPLVMPNEILTGILWNILINMGIVILVYLIFKKVFGSRIAFFTSLVAIISIPLIAYIRHFLPYDGSILLALIGFYLWLRKNSYFLFGLFLGVSFLVYPSHFYYFLPLPAMFLIFDTRPLMKKFKSITIFAAGFSIPILFMQVLSFGTIPTYFQSLQDLSKSVTQGDYELVFIFLKQYIVLNEGIAALIFAGIGCVLIAFRYKEKPFIILITYLISEIFILEIYSHIIHLTVLYARTTRPLYVIFVLAYSSAFFQFANNQKTKKFSFLPIIFVILLAGNWLPHYLDYKNTVFVQDFIQQASRFPVQISGVWDYRQKDSDPVVSAYEFQRGIIYMENRDIIYPYYGMKNINCNQGILYEKTNALISFKPYYLEGFDNKQREIIEQNPPRHEVFKCI